MSPWRPCRAATRSPFATRPDPSSPRFGAPELLSDDPHSSLLVLARSSSLSAAATPRVAVSAMDGRQAPWPDITKLPTTKSNHRTIFPSPRRPSRASSLAPTAAVAPPPPTTAALAERARGHAPRGCSWASCAPARVREGLPVLRCHSPASSRRRGARPPVPWPPRTPVLVARAPRPVSRPSATTSGCARGPWTSTTTPLPTTSLLLPATAISGDPPSVNHVRDVELEFEKSQGGFCRTYDSYE
jgi:hypothetical protein